MKPYWSSRGELSVVQNIPLKASRIVIPSSMRLEILNKITKDINESLKAVSGPKTLFGGQDLAERSMIWWNPCRVCALQRDNKSEPPNTTPLYLTVPGKS